MFTHTENRTSVTQHSILLLKESTSAVARRLALMTQPIRPPPSLENVERVECVGLRAWRVLRDVSATAPLERPENAPECSENVDRAGRWARLRLCCWLWAGLRAPLSPSAPPDRSDNV